MAQSHKVPRPWIRGGSAQLGGERFPTGVVPAALEAADDASLGVDGHHVRLVLGPERACPPALRIEERRPVPAVPAHERARVVEGAGDADAEVRELRMLLLEVCVGDRLALARASPRCPDVHEQRATAVVRQRDGVSVEGHALDERRRLLRELTAGGSRRA